MPRKGEKRKEGPGKMIREEAGKKGGEETEETPGQESYQEIGEKGGAMPKGAAKGGSCRKGGSYGKTQRKRTGNYVLKSGRIRGVAKPLWADDGTGGLSLDPEEAGGRSVRS